MRTAKTRRVLDAVADERASQDVKWGEQNHLDYPTDIDQGAAQQDYAGEADAWKELNELRVRDGDVGWDGILLEEVYEALAESAPDKLRAELVQVAAVAVAWIEAIDRRDDRCQGCGNPASEGPHGMSEYGGCV